ncbi:HD domain-containing protein [Oscillospiraceae bacterium OttesenSCG-928-F05]|nr:HD domain-containing protein [Oscillospiraceae bacterium OttesenSCG-928-F05]
MDLKVLAEATQFSHSRFVSELSTILARRAGYSPEETMIIQQAALYHDIGKTFIPKEILNKPGPLTSEEFEIVKTHTAIGYEKIIEIIGVLCAAAVVAGTHHEKWDGSGYMGLEGPNIHPYARLISVADVFDALLAKRPYKEPWAIEDIAAYFDTQAGKQFDAGIVQLLLQSLEEIAGLYNPDK